MSVYETEYKVLSSDVDLFRRLRLRTLHTWLQEASIAHTEALGAGRDKTLDRGLLWIVVQQEAKIFRLPEYDEHVHVASWPGKTMHVFFPRYYRVTDARGNALVEASALWALMDEKTRKTVFPEQWGVEVPAAVTGDEAPLPRVPRTEETQGETVFTVPFSCVDLNGHMNNTRYFDLADDLLPERLRARTPRNVAVEYSGEARCGEAVTLRFAAGDDGFYLSGERDKRLFRLRYLY